MCVSVIAGGGSAYTLFLLSDRQPEPISATEKPKSWKIYMMTLVEQNILLFYGDRQSIKDLKLSTCSVPLSCYLDDVMWGLWNNYNTYIVNLLAYMTANLMSVRGHVPTKFELQYTVIDRDANQTTKMRSCFGCYHDALEIIFGLWFIIGVV